MLISEAIGNISNQSLKGKNIDYLELEWYEMTKRIQRKKTKAGENIAIKFLKEGQRLTQGDILYLSDEQAIVVSILPAIAIVLQPTTLMEMGTLCYEIGNKHIPLFIQNNEVLLPYEEPVFRWLMVNDFNPKKEKRRLTNLLKSNVDVHGHGTGNTLFTKILQLTSKNA